MRKVNKKHEAIMSVNPGGRDREKSQRIKLNEPQGVKGGGDRGD